MLFFLRQTSNQVRLSRQDCRQRCVVGGKQGHEQRALWRKKGKVQHSKMHFNMISKKDYIKFLLLAGFYIPTMFTVLAKIYD